MQKFENTVSRLTKLVPTQNAQCAIDLSYAGSEAMKYGQSSSPCHYLTDKERKPLLLRGYFQAGCWRLFKLGDGKPYDTTGLTSKDGNDYAAYCLDYLGRLYVHQHISASTKHPIPEKYFFHSSFLSGGRGICFGMIKISKGKITHIDNRSGHYKPSKIHLKNAVTRLIPYFSLDAEVYCQDAESNSVPGIMGLFSDEISGSVSPTDFLCS